MKLWPFSRKTEPPRVEPAVRRYPVHVRHYNGASKGPIYADFTASSLSADAELHEAITTLRARARNLERNNGHARRFIQLMQDNVVGHQGFMLQVKARFDNGGMDTPGNTQIEQAWRRWCRVVTADGMMTFTEASRMVVRTWARDGEVFVQRVRSAQYPDRVAYHFVEADQIDETLNQVFRSTGNQIRMGVEIDGFDKPVAYHVLTKHPGDYTWSLPYSNKKYVRIPADRMLHIYVKRRPGQTRGEPPMAPVMNDIKMLGGYREAEITHRRAAASKMGFFERDEASGPVSGVADAVENDGELIMEVEPGRMTALPVGYKFQPFDANSTSTDYGAFEKQIIRSIATGLGPSYFDLAMDLDDVSYSSIRQGALSDRDFYRGSQVFIISRWAMPVYQDWLETNLGGVNPRVNIPVSRFDKFFDASKFIPRGWQWVDPQKEVKAQIEAINNKMSSRSQVVAEQGGDFDQIITDLVFEKDSIAAAGLDVEENTE